ncbi:DUF6868 family protein [Sulfurimonas sp.]
MDILNLEEFLLWCFIINYSVLFLWFFMFVMAKDLVYNLHSKWFDIPREKFDGIHYIMLGFYKLFIFLFNLVPYLALRIIG